MTGEIYRDKIVLSVIDLIKSSRFETRSDVSFMYDNVSALPAAGVKEYFGEQEI